MFPQLIVITVLINCLIVSGQRSGNPWEFFRVGPDLRAESSDYPHHSHIGYHFPRSAALRSAAYTNNNHDDHHHHPSDQPDQHNHYHRETHNSLIDDHSHGHGDFHEPGKAPPGYPSSDFVKYFAKYTSSGGKPKSAPHSYYSEYSGHVHNFNFEPENAVPRSQKLVQPKTDPFNSHRNFVATGPGYLYRADTGHHTSPTGEGPLNGFYYGPSTDKAKLFIGDRPFYF